MALNPRFLQSLLLIISYLFCSHFLLAQSALWTDIDDTRAVSRNTSKLELASYRALELDFTGFQEQLTTAPERYNRTTAAIIDLPMPDGKLAAFKVWKSTILQEGLAKKYPSIQTYTIQSIAQPSITGRLGYTPEGVHALIMDTEDMILVEPLFERQANYYASYYAKDALSTAAITKATLSCGQTIDHAIVEPTVKEQQRVDAPKSSSRSQGEPVDLAVYRLAMTNTGEYARFHSADLKGEVLFQFVKAVNLVNAIYEKDFAIQLQLIDETEDLIFLDPATDPFDLENNVFNLLGRSAFAIETRVNVNKFDIGHVVSGSCFTGGGAAGVAISGVVCTFEKSSGASCQFRRSSLFAVNIFAHEIGHQFSASHSWSNCPGIEGQRSGTTYEPGSGSTIMSYAGSCGPQNNIQPDADSYFHIANIEQIERHEAANTCATLQATGNIAPVAIIDIPEGLVLPILTPFELKGIGMDENGDELTYCWEQYDLGLVASNLNAPVGNAPIFRSYPPNNSPNRTIPRLQDIINNNSDIRELLPDYSRDINFQLTIRDNHPEAGGVDWKSIAFKTTAAAGPFKVIFPNKGTDVLRVGEAVTVEWDVANTEVAPVNCQKVNILLSIDGGFTYPDSLILATEVENDGTQIITVPNLTSRDARIKVAAANNIFFDISNNSFDILSPTQSGFSFASSIQSKQICLPEKLDIALNTVALLDYSDTIQFDILEGLPEGAMATFQSTSIAPGESNQVALDFENVTAEGPYEVIIRGIAPNADTIFRTVELDLVRNDFSDLQLVQPENNSIGLSLPNYQWQASEDAITYDIEIATSPAFGETVIDKATSIRALGYPSTLILEPNTIYYWRVLPFNECGEGKASEIFAFQTETFNCSVENSAQVPVLISAQGTPTIESTIDINQSFEISDLNVTSLRGTHDWVSHIRTTLISPQGTEVVLFGGKCPGAVPFNLGFDDEAAASFPCPPIGGIAFIPSNPLSAFDGEDAFGTWTLRIEVLDSFGEGGALDEWSLEFCSNVSLDPPILVTNTAMPVQPSKGRVLTSEFLASEDANNTASELQYTVVAAPDFGQLLLNGTPLVAGTIFTQRDLDNNRITYRNEAADKSKDRFTFTVTDGEGGWVGITPFEIVLDAAEMTTPTVEVALANLINLYPNPAQAVVYLEWPSVVSTITNVRVFNIKGQLLKEVRELSGTPLVLSTSELSEGIYFVRLDMEEGVVMKKLVVQR